jgi:hypothetical protein
LPVRLCSILPHCRINGKISGRRRKRRRKEDYDDDDDDDDGDST